jgi:DNA recombination protein RmuC
MIWLVAIAWLSFLTFFLWLRFEKGRASMQEAFKAASMDVFTQQSATFLQLAETHLSKYQEGAKMDLEGRQKAIDVSLERLQQSMQKVEVHAQELEKRREGAYTSLVKQIDQMMVSDRELRRETSQLVQALRSPNRRGSWGQVHLRRVVELAGLIHHCDFNEQVQLDIEGKILRPDLVVRLPGQREIVVDAKTPLDAYLEAMETQEEEKKGRKLQEHAAMLRKHIKDLSTKEYWKAVSLSPEYVILFLPAEAFFSAALEADPTLIEVGADQNVILATPTTLIAILRAVAFTWKQEGLSKGAKEIAKIGAELYERLGVVSEHWVKLGKNLGHAVEAYNQSMASLESRVLVSARKLKEVSGLTKELPPLEPIEKWVRVEEEV